MQKVLLHEILAQNRKTCLHVFDKITPENARFRSADAAASAGFIYRHVGETINRLGIFLGVPTDVRNSTLGKADEGQGENLEESKKLVHQGFDMLQQYVENTPDADWQDLLETPFFGTVSRVRLFSHVLFHNAYHVGQIALTLTRGKQDY
jgi:hypothetical protein